MHALFLRDLLGQAVVIPVITIDNLVNAVPLAKALVAGGIRVLEITLRSPHGFAAIAAISQEVPEAYVGVGTLIDATQCAAARDAGAVFGVSPGLTTNLLDAVRHTGLPLLPGVMTPSDIMVARDAGFHQMKLFPAVPAGGVPLLKTLQGPFADVLFCPTGGISIHNAADFLACDNVLCVGGSWLTPRHLIDVGDWVGITALAKQAVQLKKIV